MKAVRLALFATAISLAAFHPGAAQELKPAPSIAGASTAVPAEVEFTILAEWQVGDEYRIDAIKERTDLRGGILNTGKGWAVIKARVEEKTPDGYLLAWTNEEGGLDNYAQGTGGKAKEKAKETEAVLVEISKNLRSEIETADTGFPARLRNRDEMVAHMKAAWEKILATLDLDAEVQAQIRSVMQQVMSPQVVESQALTDAYLVYGLMGGSYRGGQVDTYDTQLPFPFGGQPVPATLHVLLREYDAKAGLARITSQSIPNAAPLKEAMAQWMTRMVTSQGQPAPDPSQIPDLRIQDTTEYLYDFKMGLPREVTSERFVTVAGGANVRIDRRTYRISPVP